MIKGNAMYPGRIAGLKEAGTFKGVLWHQGESNTTGFDRFLTYRENLLGIVRDIRKDAGVPDLPFVTGQLSRMSSNDIPEKGNNGCEFCGTITRVLADIGEYIDNAAHVRSTDCGLCSEHTRTLVDENGKPTGKTMRMPGDPIHFNRAGLTTLGYRYARAMMDCPSFKNDPVRLLAVPGRAIDASLVREVSDLSRDTLTFSAEGLPDWLTVKPDGSVSGTPPAVGEFKGKLTVTDRSGETDTSGLVVHVLEGTPPEFLADTFDRLPVIAGQPFRDGVRYGFHKTVTSELFEQNGDKLTYVKAGGPDWLEVSPDGSFSGTPPLAAAGKTVIFKVKVADPDGSDTAAYAVKVLGGDTVWYDGFDYLPDIRFHRVDPTYEVDAKSPRGVYFPGVNVCNAKRAFKDLYIRQSGDGFKFSRGSLKSFSILLDRRLFSGQAGDYRFRFKQFGIGKYCHLIFSIYGVDFGGSPDAKLVIRGEGRDLFAVPAPVTAQGGATLQILAEKNYRDTPEPGCQDLDFKYDGVADVLLVVSASVRKEDLENIKEEKLSKSQKRKKQRETGGISPPAFQQTGADLDDFSITRVRGAK
jgi:hypothetical protein